MGAEPQPTGIDNATLSPVVRRVLGSDTAEVIDWQCVSIHRPFNAATGGVYRVSGTALERERLATWSVVLKVGGVGFLADEPSSPQYWKRELLAYQSGFLGALRGGLKAPRCFGAEEPQGAEIRLWLEDIEDASAGKWPPDRYLLAARSLGRLSGAYLSGDSLPDYPWLSRGFLRKTSEFMGRSADLYPGAERHPLVQRGYPGDTLPRVMRLWAERDSLETALERLPRTICHHDAFRRNLIVRQHANHEEVVAVDWAFLGHGAVGEELHDLLPGSYWSRDLTLEEVRSLWDGVFESYLSGLRDAGWSGDARLARMGYAAAHALSYWSLWFAPLMAVQESWYEYMSAMLAHSFGCTIEEYLDYHGQALPLWLDLADEARELIAQVG